MRAGLLIVVLIDRCELRVVDAFVSAALECLADDYSPWSGTRSI